MKEFRTIIILACLGFFTLGLGIYYLFDSGQSQVEVIRGDDETESPVNKANLKIDIAGAVVKPGVYSVSSGSRVGDVVVMAGGFAESADLAWISKSMNLAEQVEDALKIYIPNRVDNTRIEDKNNDNRGESQGKVNINTASVSELDSLEGIGEVRAKTILDNRPYTKIDDLVSKAKIPESVYEKIKDQVSVY